MAETDDWDDGAPPGFENVDDGVPTALRLDERTRAAIRSHHESLPAAEREATEETIDALYDLLDGAHALRVLDEFATAPEPRRFGDLQESLSISPNTLSARLDEFVDAGLLQRHEYDEVPPRVEYEPTERAEALFPAFALLRYWAEGEELS